MTDAMATYIREIPKAELHVHIEGTLEPEQIFTFAERNRVKLPYASIEQLRAAYHFTDLQSFLDLYYKGMEVLRTEQDYYELTMAYLARAHADGVRHAEIFFDPQAHTGRGVPFAAVLHGIDSALINGHRLFGLTSELILCFLRHLPPKAAAATLHQALPYCDRLTGVGLDSSELGYPPALFAEVFEEARRAGFLAVAHAGEEGPAEYIWEALDILKALRIDHGVRCLDDEELVQRLRADQVPLTVCPLSNVRLHVFPQMRLHNLKRLLDQGLRVTVNSDDPAYFGGYIADNYLAAQESLALGYAEIRMLAENSFLGSFLGEREKERHLAAIATFSEHFGKS